MSSKRSNALALRLALVTGAVVLAVGSTVSAAAVPSARYPRQGCPLFNGHNDVEIIAYNPDPHDRGATIVRVVVFCRGGTVFEGHRQRGDGFGPIYRLEDRIVAVACDASPLACKVLTGVKI